MFETATVTIKFFVRLSSWYCTMFFLPVLLQLSTSLEKLIRYEDVSSKCANFEGYLFYVENWNVPDDTFYIWIVVSSPGSFTKAFRVKGLSIPSNSQSICKVLYKEHEDKLSVLKSCYSWKSNPFLWVVTKIALKF